MQQYGRLFTLPQPDPGGRDIHEALNPASTAVVQAVGLKGSGGK